MDPLLAQRAEFFPRGVVAAAQRNFALLEPSCPHPDDALWWDGFALPEIGDVRAMAEDGGDLIVAGSFSQAGFQRSLNVARWDGTHYHPFGADLPRTCEVLFRFGGQLVAGCTSYAGNGVPDSMVYLHDGSAWRALGTMTASPGNIFGHEINALASYGGELIAAGIIGHADAESVGAVARWDGSQWHALGTGFPDGIGNALVVANGRLFVGGMFTDSTAIKQWDGSTWSNVGAGLQWTTGNMPMVEALLTDGTNIYASGSQVTRSGGVAFTGLPTWNGDSWSSLGSGGAACLSHSLAWFGGQIAASRGGTPGRVGVWNGSTWVTLPLGPRTQPKALFEWNSKLITESVIGPVFSEPQRQMAWDGASWTLLQEPWVPGIMAGVTGTPVAALNWQGQLVVAGFSMSLVGAQDHYLGISGVASWDGSGWTSLGPSSSSTCLSITTWRDTLVVGTFSSNMGGVNCNHVARWNGASWAGFGPGLSGGGVRSVLGRADGLYAFGDFNQSGSTVVNRAARWDGSSWQPLGAGFSSQDYPYESVSWGSDLVVCGGFDSAGAVPASNIARWDGSTWHALGSGLDDVGYALAEFNGDLIAGGEFSHAGGTPAGGIARWNGTDWSPMGENVSYVSALRVIDGRLYAGGVFLCAGGEQVSGVAVWDGVSWHLTGSGSPVAGISFIEPWNGALYVGGNFDWMNGHASSGMARWDGLGRVGVPVASVEPALSLRTATANPSASTFDFTFSLPAAGHVRLAIFDLVGRRVATLRQGVIGAGIQRAHWSGRNDRGEASRSGVYFARLETTNGTKAAKLVLSR